MIVGGILQSSGGNGRDLAQNPLSAAGPLAAAPRCASVGIDNGVPIQSSLSQHLFRTPSLDGQASPNPAGLPVIFPASSARRGIAQSEADTGNGLKIRCFARCLCAQDKTEAQGWASCSRQNFLWPRSLQWGFRPVATPWANRRLSAVRWEQAQRPSSAAIWRQAPQWGPRATSYIASNIQVAADPALCSGPRARSLTNSTSRAARGDRPRARFCVRVALQDKG